MILALTAPQVAFRDCRSCLRFVYDEKTGEIAELAPGKPLERRPGMHAPCYYGACAKGSPTAGRELTNQNLAAWRHYRRCKAVGRFPEDLIVEQNALIISDAEAEAMRIIREQARRGRERETEPV